MSAASPFRRFPSLGSTRKAAKDKVILPAAVLRVGLTSESRERARPMRKSLRRIPVCAFPFSKQDAGVFGGGTRGTSLDLAAAVEASRRSSSSSATEWNDEKQRPKAIYVGVVCLVSVLRWGW